MEKDSQYTYWDLKAVSFNLLIHVLHIHIELGLVDSKHNPPVKSFKHSGTLQLLSTPTGKLRSSVANTLAVSASCWATLWDPFQIDLRSR